jgi:UDP-galactose transporter B1
LEALANIIVGYIGMTWQGPTPGVPLSMFAISGASQVSAKACLSLALANGLSFPVATLAKSGKMAPVMGGTLLLGGAKYSLRDYLQVAAIIGGTAIVSLGKKSSKNSSSSSMGVFYITMALVFDGVTAGYQKRLQRDMAQIGVKPKPYDFMFWTNLFMGATALVIALTTGDLFTGWTFCVHNPSIFSQIIQFSLCSAIGQSVCIYIFRKKRKHLALRFG